MNQNVFSNTFTPNLDNDSQQNQSTEPVNFTQNNNPPFANPPGMQNNNENDIDLDSLNLNFNDINNEEQPQMQQPVQEQPQMQQPVQEQPQMQQPVQEQPQMQQPVQEQPQMQQPVQEQPQMQQPVQEQPQMQQPVQEQPQMQQPVQEQPQMQPQSSGPVNQTTQQFTPNTTNIIGAISPANFDNLIKILKTLTSEKSSDNITIRQSMVMQGTSEYIIEANLTNILSYNGKYIDLDIINPTKYVSLFSQFRSQNNIFITDDDENSRFIITNGEIKLFLPKQDDTASMSVQGFELTNAQSLAQRKIDRETRKVIKGLSKGQDYIEYLIHNNEFKAIHIPNTAIYVFPEYQNDSTKLDETNADLILRTSSFLPVESEEYQFYLIKLSNGNYISLADCNVGGQISVRITEQCEMTIGGNTII